MAKPKEVQLMIPVNLTEDEIALLGKADPSIPAPNAIVNLVADSLRALAAGGAITTPQTNARFRKAIGSDDPVDVVKAVEKAAGMEDGRYVAKWRPDPFYLKPLEELARKQSITVEKLLQNTVDWVIDQGMLYNVRAPFMLRLSEPDRKWLEGVMKTDKITGESFIAWLKDIASEPETVDLFES